MAKPTTNVPPEVKAKAARARAALKDCPPLDQLLTPEESADAAPFYFALRAFIADLRAARQDQDLTLADVAARSGLAVETVSRLETGALVNPTWQTLGRYAVGVGRRVRLLAERPE